MPNNNVVIEGKVWALLFRFSMAVLPVIMLIAIPWGRWVTTSISDLKAAQIEPADYRQMQRDLAAIAATLETNQKTLLQLPPAWLTSRMEEIRAGQICLSDKVQKLSEEVARLQVQVRLQRGEPEDKPR